MNHIDWQIERMREVADRPAIAWRGDEYTYADLYARYEEWLGILESRGVAAGDCVGVVGDYSPAALGCLLALVKLRCILVPMSWDSVDQHEQFCRIAELDWRIEIDAEDRGVVASMDERRGHAMLEDVRKSEQAGLILFSSGSTGAPKAALHRL
jgi:long-chain acyl-CoA synthetase